MNKLNDITIIGADDFGQTLAQEISPQSKLYPIQ
jgi:hypothetical protein|tara:strand:- start:3891 stop:3992 length:102 start_codon:yes stop_codon:yes gene_type:complete